MVNCLGVLQDGPGSDTGAVHRDFVARLLQAIRDSGRAIRLVHISIPGAPTSDRTAFSQTKREAERLIAASGIAYAILRPGFVVAPAAYGGSAMLRALAAFPLDLPAAECGAPFQPVAVEDIAATIAWLAARDADEANAVTWDLMQPQPVTLGDVIDQFRRAFGTARWPRIALPAFLLDLGAKARRSRQPARLDAADAHHRDRGTAPRRHAAIPQPGWPPPASCRRRIEQMVGQRPAHHSGQMVCAAVPDQGAGDRKPRAVLDRVGLHFAGDFL